MTSSTTEDNERTMGFVDFHRFTARRAFRVREREDFALLRIRKFESTFAIFAEELLVAVFVMTVFEDKEPHFGQEGVELFISGYLLKSRLGGVPCLKNNAVFG